MSGIFSRAVEGQPLRIPAQAYNAAMDAAEHFATRGRPTGGGPIAGTKDAHQLVINVRNDSGYQLNAGDICWLDELESGIVYDQDRYEANALPTHRAVFSWRVSTKNANQRFGVCLDPIPAGEIGPVVIRGICAAYILEVPGQDGDGQSADPLEKYGRYAFPGTYAIGSTSHRTVLYRGQARGPVEILQLLSQDPALITVGDGLVYDGFYLVDVQQDDYCVTSVWNGPQYSTTYEATYQNIGIIPESGEIGSQYLSASGISDSFVYEGFYKQFAATGSTSLITSLDANGIIENSIIRIPYEGIWEVDLSACGRVFLNSDASAIAIDATSILTYQLSIKTNTYAVAIVPVDSAGAEITVNSSAYRESRAFPPTPGGVPTGLSSTTLYWDGALYGGPVVSWTGLYNNTSANGPRVTFGSYSCRARLHFMAGTRLGVRVRLMPDHTSSPTNYIPAHVLDVWGRLTARPAPMALQTSVGNTVIVGTPGASAGYEYTVANTGTTAPAGVSLSTYAWAVWCPDGQVETATGASFNHNYSDHGEGEYVAKLTVTYNNGLYGAEEFRFSLPNP